MTRPSEEDRLREAFRAMPRADPTDAQVAEVLRRARARRSPADRRAAVVVVALLVLALAVLALPPGRSALASAVGELQGFFQGGEAPGGERPPLDIGGAFDDVAPGTSRVLLSRGDLRLVGYRQSGTNWACVSLGSYDIQCAGGDRWATRTAGHAVVVLGTTTPPTSTDIVLWGLAEDGVARVELVDAAGRTLRASLGTNAFLVVVPAGRAPATLVARDRRGVTLETTDVTTLRWGSVDPASSGSRPG